MPSRVHLATRNSPISAAILPFPQLLPLHAYYIFPDAPTMELAQLAVPAVYILIFFLGYPSQYLLTHLEPAPLTRNELIVSNVILVLILITYTQSVFVDPGTIPRDWNREVGAGAYADADGDAKERGGVAAEDLVGKSRKWCFRCEAAKPPRAHHCKECKR